MSDSDQTRSADNRARHERDRQLDDVLGVIAQQAQARNRSRAETVAAVLQELPEVSPDRLESAVQAAHKLAGSAGTFGMAEASRLARGLERFLSGTDRDGAVADGRELDQARAEVGELQRLLTSQ